MHRPAPRRKNLAENDGGACRNRCGGQENGRQNFLHVLARVHQYGRGEKGIHARIYDPARKRTPRTRISRCDKRDFSARKKHEGEQNGYEHEIEERDALCSAEHENKRDGKSRKRQQRLVARKQRVQPRKHSRTGNERQQKHPPLDCGRRAAEQALYRVFVTAVLASEPQQQKTQRAEQRGGK